MDAQTCLKKLQYVGVLNFATVDKSGIIVCIVETVMKSAPWGQ